MRFVLRGMAAALLAAAAHAQEPATSASGDPAPGALRLDLDEAIDRALDGAFGLRVARHDLAGAESSLLEAENRFDFKLTATFQDGHSYLRNFPVDDPLDSDPLVVLERTHFDESQSLTVRLAKDLKIGGSVELLQRMGRERGLLFDEGVPADPLDDAWRLGEPGHVATTQLSWTIPLWGGRGRRVATASLVSAETGMRVQSRGLVEREMQLVVDVVRAFYLVLRTESVLRIDRDAVTRAEDNLRTFQLRLEEGLVTPIDVARAERELRSRQDAVVSDEEALQSARDQLVQLLALPLTTDVNPEGEPVYQPVDVELVAATEEALEHRADLRSQRESLDLAELSRDVARSGTRPKLELTLSAGFRNVGGEEASKWFDFARNDDWIGGFELSYTFGEKGDDEALVRSLISEASSRVRLEELEREIVLQVKDAVRGVRSLERRIALLEDNVALAAESLRLAQLQLEEDLIRTTDLLQIQDELVRAQTDRVNALYDHAIARVSLDLALGRYAVGETRRRSDFLRGEPPTDVPVLPRVRLSGEEPSR